MIYSNCLLQCLMPHRWRCRPVCAAETLQYLIFGFEMGEDKCPRS